MKTEKEFPHFDAQTVGSQGNAILGIRDSGKSYTAIKLAEMLFDAGIPFVAFDPIGRWRFMRVPGHGRGYPIVVAGGKDGDLPLTVATAPQIVRAAMQTGVSVVLDLYDMEVSKADWKRIVGDSVRVLLYENDSLRHIFIEEAAEFAPQRVGPDQGRVYAEIEKLARMGGNVRLGYTLINQRAEEVNKAVLELCDNLFLHRQKGRNSLNALTKWLNVADVKPGSRAIIQSLPTLPQGECWAWMAGTDRPVHIKVPGKNSFEPDRYAMRGSVEATPRKPVDVAEFVADLKRRLAGKAAPTPAPAALKALQPTTTIERGRDKKVRASEARALRAENAELRQRLARLEGKPASPAPVPAEPAISASVDEIVAEVIRRITADPVLIKLASSKPSIDVEITRKVMHIDGMTPRGRVVALVARGFFDSGTTNGAIRNELRRTGSDMSPVTIAKFLDDLRRDGFITQEDGSFTAVPDMKVNIVEAA